MKQITVIIIALACLLTGCDKALLDEKPNQALLIPKTLTDFSALLDNTSTFNFATGMINIAADEWQITDAAWQTLVNPQERNSYIWADDIHEGMRALDWNKPYAQIFYANIVLDGLPAIDSLSNPSEYRRIKGTALYNRGFAFYNLAQLFCAPFLSEVDGALPGIPVRLEADVNIPSVRGTVAGTYQQLLADLHAAETLLPETTPFKTRPTRAAVLAILARVYQSINRHADALHYADLALAAHATLLDYNTLDSSRARPMPIILPNGNDEVIQYFTLHSYGFHYSTAVSPTAELVSLYHKDDLRKILYFTLASNGLVNFRGSYTGNTLMFCGPATDELLLIRAESLARAEKDGDALTTLNKLLETRYAQGTYVPYEVAEVSDVLGLILTERRKELVGRGLRWTDLRRLNTEPGRETTIIRELNGQIYRLEPRSPRYVFPLPDFEVDVYGLEQNPR